jgi:hypothetical protein
MLCSIEFEAKHCTELLKLGMCKVLGEQVHKVLCSFNEVELDIAISNNTADVVVANVDVLGASVCHSLGHNEDGALVVTADENWVWQVTNLFEESLDPDTLAGAIWIAMYSASVEDRATVHCARDIQVTMPFPSFKKKPVWDLHMVWSEAQSKSM